MGMWSINPQPADGEEIVVERVAAGKPHAGKVLAAIHPHADDVAVVVLRSKEDMQGRATVSRTLL